MLLLFKVDYKQCRFYKVVWLIYIIMRPTLFHLDILLLETRTHHKFPYKYLSFVVGQRGLKLLR